MGIFGENKGGHRRVILAVFAMICLIVVGRSYMSVEMLRHHRASIEVFVTTHPISAPLVFCCALSVVLACSLPGEMFLTALCGVLLSPWLVAVLTSWAAHIIGGIINFSLLRAAWYGSLPQLFGTSDRGAAPILPTSNPATVRVPSPTKDVGGDEPVSPRSREWLQWMDRKVRGAPSWLLVVIRLVPPLFGPLNAAMAVVDVPLSTYIWTTALGTLPSQIILTLFARQLADTILEESSATPAPPSMELYEEEDAETQTSHNFWLQFLSPSTGYLPPRIRPWTVPLVVPLAWFAFLWVVGVAMQKWRLPQSRMWRRHTQQNHRAGGVLTI
eukprot:TRINITY_DN2273_c1_g1_i1.p1 TRINITY_DN2273_c1_g1~~TRINITY_DN2273_c1_g1_i1.p1  ORF type:complete len:329 (+),score=57.29 TRINITY_DN2273_c1_g1_i1:204-1190(+)